MIEVVYELFKSRERGRRGVGDPVDDQSEVTFPSMPPDEKTL